MNRVPKSMSTKKIKPFFTMPEKATPKHKYRPLYEMREGFFKGRGISIEWDKERRRGPKPFSAKALWERIKEMCGWGKGYAYAGDKRFIKDLGAKSIEEVEGARLYLDVYGMIVTEYEDTERREHERHLTNVELSGTSVQMLDKAEAFAEAAAPRDGYVRVGEHEQIRLLWECRQCFAVGCNEFPRCGKCREDLFSLCYKLSAEWWDLGPVKEQSSREPMGDRQPITEGRKEG